MAHLHSIYDSDLHFLIDPATRVITNQSENKNSMIQFDHNSERFTFELPRYVEEHDMLTCNHVEVHYVNIDAKNGDTAEGVYEVQDLQVSPHDDNVVICSWLVSHNATKYAGTLNFVLRFACITNDVDYVWNTAIFKNYAVQNGLYNSDPVEEQYADVLAQWYESLFTASDDGVANIGEAKAAAITAIDSVADERIADIEQVGQDVLTSLPEDYLELIENVAPPIVDSASGESIAITDSAKRKLRGLTLYGKSTQDGTPTPDAPVEIESVENPTVRVCGKNLLKVGRYSLAGSETNLTIFDGFVKLPTVLSWKQGFDRSAGSALFVYTVDGVRRFRAADEFGGSCQLNIDDGNNLSSVELVNWAKETGELSEMQLEMGEEATEYEAPTTQTLPLTHTLHGIPVASDGNYTDSDGQQWICDEVDFARRVYVQRVEKKVLNGTERLGISNTGTHPFAFLSSVTPGHPKLIGFFTHGNYGAISDQVDGYSAVAYSNGIFRIRVGHETSTEDFSAFAAEQYENGNPITMVYALAAPIETPLSSEELAAYAALRSNYPNTSVLNDGGAGMAVSYVADTKLYIDRR